ncbi:glycosyltransferase family A protein [Macrococcus capreoli]
MIPIRKRIKDIDTQIEQLKNNTSLAEINTQSDNTNNNSRDYKKGISVVIPIYQGEKYIEQLIHSLSQLKCKKEYIEYLFILNGSEEQIMIDLKLLKSQLLKFKMNDPIYKILFSDTGASKARNKGIQNANYSHVLFLDCDDTLHESTIEVLQNEIHNTDEIILFHIMDVQDKEVILKKNVIENEIQKFEGKTTSNYIQITKIISMNGAKLIPTKYLINNQYNISLKSGEDVELMMRIIARNEPVFRVINKKNCIYYRHIVPNSVSRQHLSYDFNVVQRLAVISALAKLLNEVDNGKIRELIMNRMDAQAGFINKYLHEHKADYGKIINQLQEISADYLPYAHINKGLQEILYIGYCFAPYADTSGVVLSKRIAEMKLPCDVISNDMSSVREVDLSLKKISVPYIHRHFEITSRASFSNWNLMNDFIRMGYKKASMHQYKAVYSRALWPASHFLAYKIKNKNKNIKWIAEFSDPVLYDIKNNKRHSKITNLLFLKKLKHQTPKRWVKYINNNLFDMVEIIPFIFADEIIFTNNNQMKIMIDRLDDIELKKEIEKKAVIRQHPTLSEKYYESEDALIYNSKETFNIGYFGNFYETRGLKEVYTLLKHPELIKQFNPENKKLSFSIFTSNPSQGKALLDSNEDQIDIFNALPYFEFLNATKKFDALIVMDAHTKGYKDINPYLPSKLSDYKGSNRNIIAFVEDGSPMDQMVIQNCIKIKMNSE